MPTYIDKATQDHKDKSEFDLVVLREQTKNLSDSADYQVALALLHKHKVDREVRKMAQTERSLKIAKIGVAGRSYWYSCCHRWGCRSYLVTSDPSRFLAICGDSSSSTDYSATASQAMRFHTRRLIRNKTCKPLICNKKLPFLFLLSLPRLGGGCCKALVSQSCGPVC